MTKVLYVHDFMFLHAEDESYTAVGMPESYFNRFFESGFTNVDIVSRGAMYAHEEGYEKIDNPNIHFSLKVKSNYLSIFNPFFLLRLISIIRNADQVVVNLPSIIGSLVVFLSYLLGKRYSIELAAQLDAFSTKRFGFIVSAIHSVTLPFFIKRAVGVAYVGVHLKNKYPTDGKSLVASNVNLNYIRGSARENVRNPDEVIIGFAGALNRRKGVHVIIDACGELKDQGFTNIKFHLLGGHADEDWSAIVCERGLTDYFVFRGIIRPENVSSVMDDFDIYVQPSYSEGVARATIEAMGCALPTIATDLPGFRLLLNPDMLVQVGDSKSLARKIRELLESSELYSKASKDNLLVSHSYSYDKLSRERIDFYSSLLKENLV